MTRQFVDPGAAFEDAAERASGMTERQFLKRLLALTTAGQVEATGFRLQGGRYVDPLERLAIPSEDWREALLVKNQSRVASDRPSGWILIRDGGDRWALSESLSTMRLRFGHVKQSRRRDRRGMPPKSARARRRWLPRSTPAAFPS